MSYRNKHNAHNMRSVNFVCDAPEAQSVTLVGDFNNWNAYSHPMKKQPDGAWLLRPELKHGHHRYAYLVDGVMTLDPRANGTARNPQGEKVSLLSVN